MNECTQGSAVVPHFVNNPENVAWFITKYRRPFPLHELINATRLEPLACEMSRRIRMSPVSGNLRTVCDVAGKKMQFVRPNPARMEVDDSVEPLSSVVRRCGIDVNGVVYVTDGVRDVVAQMLLRDLISFEEVLWGSHNTLIDADGRWIVIATHNTLAGFLRLRDGPSRA